MADDPRKVGVYDTDGTRTTTGSTAGHMNWWIIALVVLLILVALYFLF
ncbi:MULTISPECIES: hypothetical protein [Azospirillum]|uniref:Type VI protein secretion system component VasF n=1 Tax=Azospirillum rugosum TaxID=416170 RepID=A0ABS4SSQ7_9PROT|nr:MULTISPECIES: hypothetical protein [Azospirillum]MBP2295601.1 type VI protein secretion system component VasF [Azospirillum rugosum]MCW2235805.1 type VI protein secretion system component VasF [Azospirillum canadense]MDQ0529509.1 type VI protein secretion system component VasF [Azospirillum rugosum]